MKARPAGTVALVASGLLAWVLARALLHRLQLAPPWLQRAPLPRHVARPPSQPLRSRRLVP